MLLYFVPLSFKIEDILVTAWLLAWGRGVSKLVYHMKNIIHIWLFLYVSVDYNNRIVSKTVMKTQWDYIFKALSTK